MNIYLVGPAERDEFLMVAISLGESGHTPFFPDKNEGKDLRASIGVLLQCEAICLMDGWWTDRNGICLQTLAAWLGMKHFDAEGNKLPTNSLRG